MASLIEALNAGPKPESKCGIYSVLKALSEDERKALLKVFRKVASDDPQHKDYSAAWLARLLQENGHTKVSGQMLSRHLRGECACDGSTR